MTDTPQTTVHRSITVSLAQNEAFALFNDGIDSWWPRDGYSIGQAPLRQVSLEAHRGGRWFERSTDAEHVWGRVLQWQPLDRVVMSWQISAEWTSDPTVATEIDVRFTDNGAGRTRIDLEHHHLDHYGGRHGDMLVALRLAGRPRRVRRERRADRLRPPSPGDSGLAARRTPAFADGDRGPQDAHLAHTADLVAAGLILTVGPPVDPDDERLRGISIWSVAPDTARRMCDEDSAARAGRLAAQVATWMSPAGQLRFERVRAPAPWPKSRVYADLKPRSRRDPRALTKG